jgi:hypothetical protein
MTCDGEKKLNRYIEIKATKKQKKKSRKDDWNLQAIVLIFITDFLKGF